ncbi:Renalase [Emticicia aquatica]|uniref:Renalase n=1 Tax=Emticicia aquatica TaxID=1681835 RepID=A0ABN8EMB4_9BACT|nr:FAD-dependent oxidoreductase [Emticicia aquatica]CAH0994002.1 Renalase [Emticicia aquatica]
MKKNCIVIGAGISGLVAAHELIKNDWKVTVLDKGKGVGGRMATRRAGEARFDHGAQYFSTKTPDFRDFTQTIINANVAKEWHLEAGDKAFSHPRMIGINGMSSIPKFLAEGLSIKTNEKVISISDTENGCQVETESGNFYQANALIITIPAPQVLELLEKSTISCSKSTLEILQNIQYHPCIAVMATLNQKTNLPKPGGLSFETGNISWIADNFQKGISPIFSATIHANPAFSITHFDDDLNLIGKQLLEEMKEWIPADSIEGFQVHRWRYSLAFERNPNEFLIADSISFPTIFAGDGFGIGSIEGAYISGKNAAHKLLA